MKKIRQAVTICCLLLPAVCLAGAPHEIGGIALGARIDGFRDRIVPGSELPVRYLESLKEVEVRETQGFKTGLLYYGTCTTPARIVRIEFKYENPSRGFYDELLKRFKRHHGAPDEWRGDPFHIVVGWKWEFVDASGNDISLILKHNKRDEEKKEGNYVKMTMWNLMKQEAQCFRGNGPEGDTASGQGAAAGGPAGPDWELLVPK